MSTLQKKTLGGIENASIQAAPHLRRSLGRRRIFSFFALSSGVSQTSNFPGNRTGVVAKALTSRASTDEELHGTVQGFLLLSGEEAGGKLLLLPMVLHTLAADTVTRTDRVGTGTSLSILLSPFTGHLSLPRVTFRNFEQFCKDLYEISNKPISSPASPESPPRSCSPLKVEETPGRKNLRKSPGDQRNSGEKRTRRLFISKGLKRRGTFPSPTSTSATLLSRRSHS